MTTRDSTIFFPSYLIFLQFVLQLLLIGINTQSINQSLEIRISQCNNPHERSFFSNATKFKPRREQLV